MAVGTTMYQNTDMRQVSNARRHATTLDDHFRVL
jgi:hypothetical protein